MKKIIFAISFILLSISHVYSQEAGLNTSFISTNLFSGYCSIGSMIGTSDGGYTYKLFVTGICSISGSKQEKYKIVCLGCFGYKWHCDCKLDCDTTGGSFLVKSNNRGQIEWIKTIFAKPFGNSIKSIGGSGVACYNTLKQTKDEGYICCTYGRICKLDKKGNLKWELYFDRDSIPGIKKTGFLLGACISDITECKDGSFIALLDASFSLLKISKDGKPLWLKSTVFDEFSPMFFDYYSEQKKWIEKTDSVGINTFIYERGGGAYIPTYNVYETNDSGYMAIGKNEYRYKGLITDYSDSNKLFFTTRDIPNGKFERYTVSSPQKIYGIRKYPIGNAEDTAAFIRQGTTVVVKTDKNGKVLWEKQFGDYSWSESMAGSAHSDLIKLANGKWLVRIRDCDSTGKDYKGNITFGSARSEFYTIDNNGNVLEKKILGSDVFDPVSMVLAPDSGYFLFEQGGVAKTDKDIKTQWFQGYGGRAIDQGMIHAVTTDTGVVCTEEGVLYKFDKYGNTPLEYIKLEKIDTNSAYVHFYFNKCSNENYRLEVKKQKGNKIKRIYWWKNRLDKVREMAISANKDYGDRYSKELKYQTPIMPGENSRKDPDIWILDLNDSDHINTIIIDARITKSMNEDLFPKSIKETKGKRVTEFIIFTLSGYSEVKIKYPEPGKYTYKLFYSKNDSLLLEGEFEIKAKTTDQKKKK